MATTTNNGWATPDDSDPFKQGASAIRTLGSAIDTSTGKGLLAWQSYTPALSGITIGNGTLNFKYCQIGKTVHVRGLLTFGSSTSLTTTVDIGTPVTAVAYPFGHVIGNFNTSTPIYVGAMVCVGSASYFRCVLYNASGTYTQLSDLTTTIPYGAGGWNTGKQIMVSYTYEAA